METAASFEARFAPWSYPAHYVVGEILLRHMSSKPVSRELHGPLRRFADYTDMWAASGLLTTWWVSC